ncbi:hypothetical protein OkiPb00406_45110 [Escherichia coli]|nr:hypothetical protein [Escherichia coli]ACI39890.1 hypothetical protein ECH74115_A0005 [Escherichia coli O157:H7 str. EC4115]AIF97155.1 hypothetical protein SS17_7003 [Escherichia coli O157:H7 str. SS17]EEQ1065474.1 hypothetical protein [Salmonella enterica]EEW1192380.1 hypothetical protein [Escherichia coli O157:H7]EGX7085362.1 hypothetical protein [Salmonella enterica subsp. enterica serovar 4:i:-]EKE4980673.1 hypothetical protein [Shigella sonnei]MED7072528.1 hypothetical protein [Esche
MPMYVVRRKRLIEGTRKQRELILKSKQKRNKVDKAVNSRVIYPGRECRIEECNFSFNDSTLKHKSLMTSEYSAHVRMR